MIPFFNLSAFYFFYFASVGLYIIFLPKLLVDIGYSSLEIGFIFAINPLMRFLTPFLFLKYIKLTKNIFILSVIGSVFFSLLFFYTIDNFYLFFINNLFLGITLSLNLPFIETIAIKKLANNYGKSRLFGSIGFIVSSFLDYKYLLEFYLITIVLNALFSIIVAKDNYENKTNSEKFTLIDHKYFWIALFLMQVGFGGFYNFFTIYESDLGISLNTISFLWSFGVVCEILMFIFQAPLLKFNLIKIIEISILFTAIRWLLLFLFGSNLVLVFISQAFHALSFGLYHSAVIMYLYKVYSNKTLAQQFMLGISYGLGGMVGSILAGIFYGKYLFLFSSIITFGALVFIYIYKKKLKVV